MNIKAFIKNYEKNGKVTQLITICVEDATGKKEYKKYFINVSNKKHTAYLSEVK